MAKRVNSASRLHELFSSAIDKPESREASRIWADVFGIKKSEPQFSHEVIDTMRLVHSEIDQVERHMQSTEFTDRLYKNAIARSRDATRITNLTTSWNHFKGNLSPDTLLAFLWISEIMPDETNQIREEDLKTIQEEIAKLETRLGEDSLPANLRAFILRHLDIVKRALRNRELVGSRALREAMYEGNEDVINHQEIIAEYEQSEEISRLKRVWGHVKKASGAVVTANKALDVATNISEKAQKALEWWRSSGG